MTNDELIQKAASVIKIKQNDEFKIGNVGCALLSKTGNLYLGVCIDTSSGMGFCAEHNAVGSMITAGEYEIDKIVAVWLDDDQNIYVLAPCGRCREFMVQIDEANLEADILLDIDKTAKLKDLLPLHDWFHDTKTRYRPSPQI